MSWLDKTTERASRRLAQAASRRGFLGGLGGLLAGASLAPLLPVARAAATEQPAPPTLDPGDPAACDYWRNCAVDGYLCSCCGGSVTSCPPGTEMSSVTWIGVCKNPGDGRNYIISYNDCCGKAPCGNCFCNRNEGDRPTYRPHLSNDYNWCLGTESQAYHCTVNIILGVALK